MYTCSVLGWEGRNENKINFTFVINFFFSKGKYGKDVIIVILKTAKLILCAFCPIPEKYEFEHVLQTFTEDINTLSRVNSA